MLREEGLEKRPANEITNRIGTSVGKKALNNVETVSEDRDIKRDFYRGTESLCRPDAVVASNTSYLDIFELAPDGLQERLLVCHFFAPPYLIPLEEKKDGMNRRDFLKKTGAAGLGVIGASLFSPFGKPFLYAGKEPINFAFCEVQSGLFGTLGSGAMQAAKIAEKHINDHGGIMGRPFKCHYEDTQAKPSEETRVAKKLIFEKNVIGKRLRHNWRAWNTTVMPAGSRSGLNPTWP
jgi:hypothetical protein